MSFEEQIMSQDKNNPAKHIFKVIGVLLLSFEYFCNIHFCTGSTSLASKIPKSFSSFQDFEQTSLQLKECASGYISVKRKETFLFSLQHRHALSVYPHFVGRLLFIYSRYCSFSLNIHNSRTDYFPNMWLATARAQTL